MNRLLPLGVMCIVLLSVVSCATGGGGGAGAGGATNDLPAEEVRGHYAARDGESWFTPCGAPAADAMWVTFTGESVPQADQARETGTFKPGERAFVRFSAAVVTDGRVGPRGPGKPALLVRRILEARPASDSDCPPSVAPSAAPPT